MVLAESLVGGSGSSQLDITGGTQQAPNSVLRVIIENMMVPVTLDILYEIFHRFGKVLRIITFNKNNTFQALVQLSEARAAQLARQALDNQPFNTSDKIKWNEKVIRVAASKHTTVQMPKEGQPDAGLTRDYAHSPLHRFKKPGSKNYMNIYPPSSTLHLSNIPPTITEEFLAQAFTDNGYTPKAFKFFL
ncbi:unnamed protein product, partial [Mesorhabditis spiculigera]